MAVDDERLLRNRKDVDEEDEDDDEEDYSSSSLTSFADDEDHQSSASCRACWKIIQEEGNKNRGLSTMSVGLVPRLGDTMPSSDPLLRCASPAADALGNPDNATPELLHQLKHGDSVLALAVSDEYIFAGTHTGEIVVWSIASFELVHTIQAHKRTVLCLFLSDGGSRSSSSSSSSSNGDADDRGERTGPLLFSSAGDAVVNVWCARSFRRLYEIYSTYDVGDMFSVAYSPQRDTVYMGAQNTTIQWLRLADPARRVLHDSDRHPDRRHHRFFDSKAVGGTSTPRRSDDRWALIPRANAVLEVQPGAVRPFAHYGYVYCMLVARGPTVLVDPDEEILISGAGDGTIKLWRLSDERRRREGVDEDEDEDSRDGRDEEEDDDEEEQRGGDIREIMVLGEDDGESVMSLAVDASFLYAGKLRGIIELWDLDTKQKLRVIKAHDGDVMTLQMSWGLLWSGATGGSACKHSTVHYGRDADGRSQNVSQKYQCLGRWKAHDGKILASAATTHQGDQLFITGGNDDNVCIWRVNGKPEDGAAGSRQGGSSSSSSNNSGAADAGTQPEDMMISTLREFVSYKTVSSRPEFAEDCRKGATFLGSLFKRLGAHVEMLSAAAADRPHNPVVFARFAGKLEPAERRTRVLFYGHYDVVAPNTQKGKWATDPFRLTGLNGYLYGRGVSDNKGPVVAALYAVTDLVQARALDSDVLFLIEGEEESGSRGFQEVVRRHRRTIGRVDYILLANSYWLDDEVPCLTYGLRGVLHATVCVDSSRPDLHSGVDGSHMVSEPLSDLTSLLAQLKGPRNRIRIPGFYDGILPLTPEEEARFDEVTRVLIRRDPARNGPADALKRSLMARWREPNLTIHRYRVSGPDGSLVSSHASANISLRLVPGQEVDEVVRALVGFLREQFEQSESGNRLTIRVDNQAEPWLGVPGSYIFRTLEEAVVRAWGLGGDGEDEEDEGEGEGGGEGDGSNGAAVESGSEAAAAPPGPAAPAAPAARPSRAKVRKPLYIREGGSIPAIRFLEKEFDAPAAHLPCGQASDAAHLDNERLRVKNLLKSREIFAHVFRNL